jgi:YVTN family beta-propeller protein
VAAEPRKGSIRDVEHVVVDMQENRSFDHYFGTLAGVRGFGDPNAITLSSGKSVFYQPDPSNPDGYLLPWHLDTSNTSSQAIPSTSHAWTVQHSACRVRRRFESLAKAHGVAVRPGTTSAWVAHTVADEVVIVEPSSGQLGRRIHVGRSPWNVAFTPDGATAYVTNANDDTVSVIDASSGRVVKTIAVGHIPTGITAGADAIWVACNTSSTISVIDTGSNQVVETVDLGLSDEPTEIAIL